jgi:hypothetical protein
MSVTHQTPVAVIRCQMCVSRKRFGNLGFDRLRQQGTCSVAQVSGSPSSPGWRKVMILSSSMAYQSSVGYGVGSHRH